MTVLVLPREDFSSESKLAKILNHLNWKVSHDPSVHCDLVLWHADCTTFITTAYWEDIPHIINKRLIPINKTRVNEVFENVFGYPIGVDCSTWHGLAVEKIYGHEVHGKVVQCPRQPNPERVYQKLITNHPSGTWVEEWRIDVYGTELLVTLKLIEKDDNGFPKATRKPGWFHFGTPVKEAFSPEEIELILKFLANIGMEYGSLDALRDLDDRLYIIDATTNTACPNPSWHGNVTEHQYIKRSAEYFERAFGK